MKRYAELRRILTEDFGFTSLAAYERWVKDVRPTFELTREVIEKLSPDNIDCRDFWRACDEIFGLDPVFNVVVQPRVGHLPYSVNGPMDANRMNLRLAKSFGIIAFLEENAHERVKTLEIGPGYGSLKNYIETHTNHEYTGVDVVPRVAGVLEATAEGFLPTGLVERERDRYSYVVCSNVFQHMSARQRSRHFKDASSILHKGGLFIFNLQVDSGAGYMRDQAGNAWCDHYGQFTPIPRPDEIQREIASRFEVLYATQRYDGVVNFVCRKGR